MTDADRVADYLAIHDLRARYARRLDDEEWAALADLFTEDAVVEYTRETLHGREEVYEFVLNRVEYEYSMHTVQMPEIRIDGDEATGEWYMLVYYVATDGTEGYVMGSYEDEYRRVDGEWKFAKVVARVDRDTGGYHTG